MSILADCCAGSTRLRVTDKGEAYAAVTGLLRDRGNECLDSGDVLQEKLVPLTLNVVDASKIGIDKLIAFRTREVMQGGHDYRALRHRYVDRMGACLAELGQPDLIQSDRNEIERQFEIDMKDDLAILRDELRYSTGDVLFLKEMIAAYLTTIGALGAAAIAVPLVIPGIVTLAGAPVAIGGLVSLRNKYLASRQAIMHKHPMAYLYDLAR